MSELEKNLKMSNWLSMLTYDAVKYAAAGGSVSATFTEDGLTLTLSGVNPDTEGINRRFRHLLEQAEKENV